MNDGVMAEANSSHGPQRRRSPRFGSPQAAPLESDDKMALGAKRFIAVRKIAPRSTWAPSGDDKENTGGQPGHEQSRPSRPELCSPEQRQRQAAMPSPILPASPPASSRSQQPAAEPLGPLWSQKVRRSYSRLSPEPDSRQPLFGFERLRTPEVAWRTAALEGSGSSVTSLLEAEPDPNIPGVVLVKERRRRRKLPRIDAEELDALAARMNAEFREAEDFQLVVE